MPGPSFLWDLVPQKNQARSSRSAAVIVLPVVTLRGRLPRRGRAILVLRFLTRGRRTLLFVLWLCALLLGARLLHARRLRTLGLRTLRRRPLLGGRALERL